MASILPTQTIRFTARLEGASAVEHLGQHFDRPGLVAMHADRDQHGRAHRRSGDAQVMIPAAGSSTVKPASPKRWRSALKSACASWRTAAVNVGPSCHHAAASAVAALVASDSAHTSSMACSRSAGAG